MVLIDLCRAHLRRTTCGDARSQLVGAESNGVTGGGPVKFFDVSSLQVRVKFSDLMSCLTQVASFDLGSFLGFADALAVVDIRHALHAPRLDRLALAARDRVVARPQGT